MSRFTLALLFTLTACAPVIPTLPASTVAATPRTARAVQLCVLTQESGVRARFNGVDEWSTEPWQYAIASVAVKHPSAGWLIIDPAFGKSIADDLARAGPIFMGIMGDAHPKQPLVDVMTNAGLSPSDVQYAVITHAHWDHTGALGDLPNAKVLLPRTEMEWTGPFKGFFDHGVMTHHLRRAKEHLFVYDFKGPALDGFDKSYDLFGDGSVVAVPLPGHTPGSVGILVRGPEGVTYLFSGDTTWTSRGVEKPAHKMARAFDEDLDVLSQSIARLHAFSEYRPDVKVIPAHDGAALGLLPPCSAVIPH